MVGNPAIAAMNLLRTVCEQRILVLGADLDPPGVTPWNECVRQAFHCISMWGMPASSNSSEVWTNPSFS